MDVVAIQGIYGSFHHEAAIAFFKNEIDISILECETFKDLVKSVGGSDADYGVMAIENSIAGAILTNYKLLTKFNLKVVGEIYLPVHINLLALKGETKNKIKKIWSHPMAILQSEDYLDENYKWKILRKNDTASCAKEISLKKLKGVGVLGSDVSAKLFGLDILEKDVQNKSESFTRFFIVTNKTKHIENSNKVSLYFTLEHRSGRLVSLLDKMARMNLNLTKIQSIPLVENINEYSFYVDVVYRNRDDFLNLLSHLDGITGTLEVLGEYREDTIK